MWLNPYFLAPDRAQSLRIIASQRHAIAAWAKSLEGLGEEEALEALGKMYP